LATEAADGLVNGTQGKGFIGKTEKTDSSITAVLGNFYNPRAGSDTRKKSQILLKEVP